MPDAPPEAEAAAAEPELAEIEEAPAADEPAPPLDDLVISGPEPAAARTSARTSPGRRTSARAARKEGRSKAALLVGVAAVIALLIAAAILLRGEIVRLWPASSAAFAGMGLAVNETGLVIEKVKFEPTFQGGRPVLSVTGAVRNVTKAAVETPPIRFSLLDKDGQPVSAKVARPLGGDVPPGATRYFAVALQDPPSTAASLDVAFETAAAADAAPEAPHAEAAPADGPTPIEAQPLPADSPDALPKHG